MGVKVEGDKVDVEGSTPPRNLQSSGRVKESITDTEMILL